MLCPLCQVLPTKGFELPVAPPHRANASFLDTLATQHYLTLADVTSGAASAVFKDDVRPVLQSALSQAVGHHVSESASLDGIVRDLKLQRATAARWSTVALAGLCMFCCNKSKSNHTRAPLSIFAVPFFCHAGANARGLAFVQTVMERAGFRCVKADSVQHQNAADSAFIKWVVATPEQNGNTVASIGRCRLAGIRAVDLSWALRCIVLGASTSATTTLQHCR